MLCKASQKLLRATRHFHPVGHFGLKMLWGQFIPIDVNVVYINGLPAILRDELLVMSTQEWCAVLGQLSFAPVHCFARTLA